LLKEIEQRTQLKVDLEGILQWVAFLPSKQDSRLSVPNCYFGVFRNGELKCRGIMARRGDTPRYIHDVQMRAIEILAGEQDFNQLPCLIPKLVYFFHSHYQQLKSGKIPIHQLVVSQTLSRDLDEFVVKSPAGKAGAELHRAGKSASAGQNVEFLRTSHPPFVSAWHLIRDPRTIEIDTAWYCEQLLRAADEVLYSFGIPKQTLKTWLDGNGGYFVPEDYIALKPNELPLLNEIKF